ncbi:hypothetical protein ACFL1X_01425 [Candidatus Hydrogenedentota bacterium]
MTPSTKLDFNQNKIARVHDLDELASILFPGNKNHQRIFLAIFIELKWSDDQFLPVLEPIADKHSFSHRSLETVRAKMRRMGLIDHVSRFNKRYGYREGWVFSNRFGRNAIKLAELNKGFREKGELGRERKERMLWRLV